MPYDSTAYTTMLQRFSFVFVLAGCFQVRLGHQYPTGPVECSRPPQVSQPGQCCQLDPFYTPEELESCTASVPKDSDNCDVLLCLLRLREYLSENNDILLDKVSAGLDKWASGTVFEEKLPKIKEYCMNTLSTPVPSSSCEQARLFQCMGALWTNNCPEEKWAKTENCATLKKHLQLCSPLKLF